MAQLFSSYYHDHHPSKAPTSTRQKRGQNTYSQNKPGSSTTKSSSFLLIIYSKFPYYLLTWRKPSTIGPVPKRCGSKWGDLSTTLCERLSTLGTSQVEKWTGHIFGWVQIWWPMEQDSRGAVGIEVFTKEPSLM